MKRLQLKGRRFGRLTVIGLAGISKKYRCTMWRCRCKCGGECVVKGINIRTGKTRSCGCLNLEHMRRIPRASRVANAKIGAERRRKPGAAFRELLGNYKRMARKRGLEWSLTDEQFKELTSSPCYYTARAPASTNRTAAGEVYVYNGVDRLDSSLGYTMENCVPCCRVVNRMKADIKLAEFLSICAEVVHRH